MRKKGFSFIEVMVAVAILSLSLLAVYAVYIKVFEASARTEKKALATAVAQEVLETAINKPFTNMALWAGSGASPMPADNYSFTDKGNANPVSETTVKAFSGNASDYVSYMQTVNRGGVTFTIYSTITWHDDIDDNIDGSDPDPYDYKRVHITVSWPGAIEPVIIDRFISLYYRPHANAMAWAEAGGFSFDDGSKYVRLGWTKVEPYTGGNKTSKTEAKGLLTQSFQSDSQVKEDLFTDDDADTAIATEDNESKTINYVNPLESDSTQPLFKKTGAGSMVQLSASAIRNYLSNPGQTWHSSEFESEGHPWPYWTPTNTWTTSWQQPSAIAKSSLDGGIYWIYKPNIPPDQNFQLFETGSAYAGSKSVVTTSFSNNKITARGWSKINDISLLEKPGLPNGLVFINWVAVRVEVEANGVTGGAAVNKQEVLFDDFHIYNPSTSSYVEVSNQAQINAINPLPSPINSITIGSPTYSTNGDGMKAQISETALTITINPQTNYFTVGGVQADIPASTVTLGKAEVNVSYTTR